MAATKCTLVNCKSGRLVQLDMKMQPVWPAIIKHDEVNDVAYLANYDDWITDNSLCKFPYSEHDLLIDSRGSVFRLVYDSVSKTVSFIPETTSISLEDFSILLRKHLCTLNECCISKLSVSSFEEGLEIVRQSLD